MRRAAHLAARTVLALLLLAAVLDLPLPAASRPRLRVHLIDRSASVFVGPDSSARPKDADAVVAFDRARRAPRDEVLMASFAGGLLFESEAVDDPRRTELRGALEAVLARDPTEIVLHSDGQADPGPALALCRARGVPVHVLPLGPAAPRDVRFLRVRVPGDAAPGERFAVEATLDATWPVTARVRLGTETRDVPLAPGAPAVVVFPDRQAGEHDLRILTEDDCPQNDVVRVAVAPRTATRRVVAVPGTAVPDLPGVELVRGFVPLAGAHAVLVDGPAPPPEQAAAIARFVRDGGGLVLVGGRTSFAAGGWAGTPLDELSPVRATPDHRVAVALAVDVSGSMKDHLRTIVEAAVETESFFGDGDHRLVLALSQNIVSLPNADKLFGEKAEGVTRVAHWIHESRKLLLDKPAGRRHILLFTDGITASGETPQDRRAAWDALAGVGLTVITADRELDIPAPHVKLKDVADLVRHLRTLFNGLRETWRDAPGPIDADAEPLLSGLGRPSPSGLNLTTAKPGAQVVATVGRAPAVYPAIALGQAGHGRTAAILFPPGADLLARAVARVARPVAGAFRLSVEPPLVRARGAGASPRLRARSNGADFDLLQVRSDLWEGRLPGTSAGTAWVELPSEGGTAAAVVPCPPEFERLGVDREALARIAAETGGRVLTGSADLLTLPPPAAAGTRGGRPVFLWAALAALFLELGIATFWKSK